MRSEYAANRALAAGAKKPRPASPFPHKTRNTAGPAGSLLYWIGIASMIALAALTVATS